MYLRRIGKIEGPIKVILRKINAIRIHIVNSWSWNLIWYFKHILLLVKWKKSVFVNHRIIRYFLDLFCFQQNRFILLLGQVVARWNDQIFRKQKERQHEAFWWFSHKGQWFLNSLFCWVSFFTLFTSSLSTNWQ